MTRMSKLRSRARASQVRDELIGSSDAFLDRAIGTLELSVRTNNLLEALGVSRVRDLLGFDDSQLLGAANFGLRSLRDLKAAVQEAAERSIAGECTLDSADLPVETPPVAPLPKEVAKVEHPDLPCRADTHDLATCWSAFLSAIEPRQKLILEARACTSKTLDQIGKELDLTRERVRQVQQRAVARFDRETGSARRLAAVLSDLLHDRKQPLYLAALPIEHSWFADLKSAEFMLDFLIDHLLRGRFGTLLLHDRRVVSRCLSVEWEAKRATARDFVSDNASAGLSEDVVRLAIEAIAGATASELCDELWEYATKNAHFSERNGERILVSFGRGVEQMVTAVLESVEAPLHYEELAERVCQRYGAQDTRRVHNAAASVGLLLGRGTYGLRRHIPVSRDEGCYLASLADGLVSEGPPGRQWHSREILAAIEDQELLAQSLSHYEISALLRAHSTLHYVGRQLWATDARGRGGVYSRIDIRNAVEAILEQEGRPLTSGQIHKRVSAIRGLGNTFQVHPRGRLIRIGPGTWGLSDRDVDIPIEELRGILDDVAVRLRDRGQAMHVSELLDAGYRRAGRQEATWQVLGVAQVDSRFRVFAGDYLGLAGWESASRVTVHEAIDAVTPLLEAGATLDVIYEAIEARLERPTSVEVVKAALRDRGATYDRERGMWEFAGDQDSDDDEPLI